MHRGQGAPIHVVYCLCACVFKQALIGVNKRAIEASSLTRSYHNVLLSFLYRRMCEHCLVNTLGNMSAIHVLIGCVESIGSIFALCWKGTK